MHTLFESKIYIVHSTTNLWKCFSYYYIVSFNPFVDGIQLCTLGGLPVFLPSGQLSGSLCRTQVLVIRDFTTTCTCTSQTIMQYLCTVHVYMFTCTCTRMHYAAIHVTCVLVGMRLYTSTSPVASLKLLLPSTVPKRLTRKIVKKHSDLSCSFLHMRKIKQYTFLNVRGITLNLINA